MIVNETEILQNSPEFSGILWDSLGFSGILWDHFGIILESFWNHFGVNFGIIFFEVLDLDDPCLSSVVDPQENDLK